MFIVHDTLHLMQCIMHNWFVRYFFGKSALSALRFFSAFKCVSLSPTRFHEKNEKTFISGKT